VFSAENTQENRAQRVCTKRDKRDVMRSAAGSNLDRTDAALELTLATPTFHEHATIN
jgi:hypothetical protein